VTAAISVVVDDAAAWHDLRDLQSRLDIFSRLPDVRAIPLAQLAGDDDRPEPEPRQAPVSFQSAI
jgi:hypothetical protein